MATILNNSYREQRFKILAGVVYALNFRDSKPNFLNIVSSANSPVYVSGSSGVDPSTYDIIVPSFGTRIFAKPNPLQVVYFYSGADANIFVGSMETVFDPAMISQTQEIAGSSASGLLGVIDIDNFLQSLPAGNNKIGGVDILSMPGLGAGSNLIGKVEVQTMPELVLEGWISKKVVALGAGVETVKGVTGQVGAVVAISAGVTVTLKDDFGDKWKGLVTEEKDFGTHNIKCDNSIKLDFSDAGEAWIIYR